MNQFKLKIHWFIQDLKKLYYKLRYNLKIDTQTATMLYQLGKGKYIDVIQRGAYLDIYNHENKEIIRLVPYQPNHGIMVEFWKDNHLRWRTHCDFKMFKNIGLLSQELCRKTMEKILKSKGK